MKPTIRRHDIDWLRVITIGLLLIYHISIVFQPWGALIGFIQSQQSLGAIWIPMSMINVWRIPLLFFVSGMGVCFAIRKRNWKALILERTQRILVPFIFGMFVIVPIHIMIWQQYYNQDITFAPQQGHLWFLKNIFIYVLLLFPIFFYIKNHDSGRLAKGLKKMFRTPFGLLLIVIVFMLEAILVNPESYEMYASTWHGFFLGMLAFIFGFILILNGETFWPTIRKWRALFILVALILFSYRYIQYELSAPNYLMAVESCMWIFAVFGFGYKHLNHPSDILSYLSQGAYPIYILHMVFLYLGSVLILPLQIPIIIKFILIVLFTCIGCFVLYELIRRIPFLRPFFGLKKINAKSTNRIIVLK